MRPRRLKKPFPSSISNMILLQVMKNMCWWLKAKQTICDHSQLIHSTCKSVLDFMKQRVIVFCSRYSFLISVLEYRILSLVLGSTLQERCLPLTGGLKEGHEDDQKAEASLLWQQAEGAGWGGSNHRREDSGKTLLQSFSS